MKNAVKDFRKRYNLTQKELSSLLGITGASVSLCETGHRPIKKTILILLDIYEKNPKLMEIVKKILQADETKKLDFTDH